MPENYSHLGTPSSFDPVNSNMVDSDGLKRNFGQRFIVLTSQVGRCVLGKGEGKIVMEW